VRGTYKNPTEDASLTGLPREGRQPVPPGAGDALGIGVCSVPRQGRGTLVLAPIPLGAPLTGP